MRVHRLQLADIIYPKELDPQQKTWPVFAYAIEHRDGIGLVDTGIGPRHRVLDRVYRIRRVPLDESLSQIGADLGDVRWIVNSHLHFDHCGNNRLFPGRPIYVHIEEYEAAKAALYTVPEWFQFEGASYRPVHGQTDVMSGVSLLETPGHTPGHQSVLVSDGNGRTLIVAQAAFTRTEFEEGEPLHPLGGGSIDDPVQRQRYVRSLRELRDLGADTTYFSHDS